MSEQPYAFPATDLDRTDKLLAVLGSFWVGTYGGNDLVRDFVAGKLAAARQARADFDDLVASVSRLTVPPTRTEHWHLLTLTESDRSDYDFSVTKYGDPSAFFVAHNALKFGQAVNQTSPAWRLPEGLADAPVMMNRMTDASLTLVRGVDYLITDDGYVVFLSDPFADDRVPKQHVLSGEDGTEDDRELGLWLFRPTFKTERVFNQFGYVLRTPDDPGGSPGTEYRDLVNAVLDALALGSTAGAVEAAWQAATGVPLVKQADETVEMLRTEPDRQLIVTDKTVYEFSLDAVLRVEEGEAVRRGQPLTDGLLFYEFHRGAVPDAAEVPALVLGRGMLSPGYFGDLVFENKNVPLVVETDDDGYTEVSFQLSGWPNDIEQFFDELHARGRAKGQTLANLLDQRPTAARDTEPTAGALPATINPVEFLVENVLRNHAFMVRYKPSAAAGRGTGLNALKVLRQVIPPQTVMLSMVQLESAEAPVTMETVEEDGSTYIAVTGGEAYDPEDFATEEGRVRLIGGRCV